MRTLLSIVVLTCLIPYIGGASETVTYKSFVDLDYGFYKVIGTCVESANGTEPTSTCFTKVNYTNKNLTINVGDTVMWINYDLKDWPITVVSDKGLWGGNDSYLKWSYRKFNYTFTEPGTYGVHIRENTKLRQTIIVNGSKVPTVTEVVVIPETIDTPVSTPIATLEQTPRVPTGTNEHKTPAITFTYAIGVILLALHFCKKE
jgi:plastocyanin